jgi:hypothetical protein
VSRGSVLPIIGNFLKVTPEIRVFSGGRNHYLTSNREKCFHLCPYNKLFEIFQASNIVFLLQMCLTFISIKTSSPPRFSVKAPSATAFCGSHFKMILKQKQLSWFCYGTLPVSKIWISQSWFKVKLNSEGRFDNEWWCSDRIDNSPWAIGLVEEHYIF